MFGHHSLSRQFRANLYLVELVALYVGHDQNTLEDWPETPFK